MLWDTSVLFIVRLKFHRHKYWDIPYCCHLPYFYEVEQAQHRRPREWLPSACFVTSPRPLHPSLMVCFRDEATLILMGKNTQDYRSQWVVSSTQLRCVGELGQIINRFSINREKTTLTEVGDGGNDGWNNDNHRIKYFSTNGWLMRGIILNGDSLQMNYVRRLEKK